MTVWSLPEVQDSSEEWFGPLRVSRRTDPYPEDLMRTFRYTAFGAVYEDSTRFELPGGGWDQLLRQYAAGERSRPAWAVGESAFHNAMAGKSVGGVQTVFLVSERSERAVLDAMKRGRMYALLRGPEPGLALDHRRPFRPDSTGARLPTPGFYGGLETDVANEDTSRAGERA